MRLKPFILATSLLLPVSAIADQITYTPAKVCWVTAQWMIVVFGFKQQNVPKENVIHANKVDFENAAKQGYDLYKYYDISVSVIDSVYSYTDNWTDEQMMKKANEFYNQCLEMAGIQRYF